LLVDILGLYTDMRKMLIGSISHRCSVIYLCLSFVWCTTYGSTSQRRTHFHDFSLTTFKFLTFPFFQVGGHPANGRLLEV